jgi:hypothetical protein
MTQLGSSCRGLQPQVEIAGLEAATALRAAASQVTTAWRLPSTQSQAGSQAAR